jgi:5-formyltetrahydrofolate cyclo-ligase
MQSHDWALNWVVTPEEIIETKTTYPRPLGLDWDSIRSEQYQKIPILRNLKEQFLTLPGVNARGFLLQPVGLLVDVTTSE